MSEKTNLENTEISSNNSQEVISLLKNMQKRLDSLEEKIESLIQKSKPKTFEDKRFSRPREGYNRSSRPRERSSGYDRPSRPRERSSGYDRPSRPRERSEYSRPREASEYDRPNRPRETSDYDRSSRPKERNYVPRKEEGSSEEKFYHGRPSNKGKSSNRSSPSKNKKFFKKPR